MTIIVPKLGTTTEEARELVDHAGSALAGAVVELDAGESSVHSRTYVTGLVEALLEHSALRVQVIRAPQAFAEHFERAADPRGLLYEWVDSQRDAAVAAR
ncbi:hypothetical protein [Frondihabitans cladoniiphilus]|uniref:hypothetical protein n=1 Tax=Frondihabitans cladoniiphilus TaxID=715785 RepID=UPI0031E5D536